MGYRSYLKAVVYGEEEALTAYMTKEKLQAESIFTHFKGQLKLMSIPFARQTVHALMLELSDVKWYDDFPDVIAWTQFIQQAPDHNLNYEFVRVGEESGDIERDEGGDSVDGLLYPRTVIETDFPQPTKEELL
jgi:hypothetical protein